MGLEKDFSWIPLDCDLCCSCHQKYQIKTLMVARQLWCMLQSRPIGAHHAYPKIPGPCWDLAHSTHDSSTRPPTWPPPWSPCSCVVPNDDGSDQDTHCLKSRHFEEIRCSYRVWSMRLWCLRRISLMNDGPQKILTHVNHWWFGHVRVFHLQLHWKTLTPKSIKLAGSCFAKPWEWSPSLS